MAREPQQYTQQGSLQDSSPLGMEQGCGVYRASLFRDMPGLGVTVGKARGKSQLKRATWDKLKGAEWTQGQHLCY